MNANWLLWVKENLERGCLSGEIKERLLNDGFTLEEIKTAMGQHYPSHLADVDHKRLANTKITRPESGAVRFPNDSIQLYTLEGFLSNTECDEMASLITRSLTPSTVTIPSADTAFRTSLTCHLSQTGGSFVREIDKRIARTMGININYSEGIQAQKYSPGQQFKAHTDFFEPHTNEYKEHCKYLGNRTWTFMVYLDQNCEGGGTEFKCLGKTILPRKGMAVTWNNLLPSGEPNRLTLHSGEPVITGTKTVITKWFRERGAGQMFEDYPSEVENEIQGH